MRKFMLIILSIGILAFSCEDELPLKRELNNRIDVPALILYEGDPATDGCGWLIQLNQELYSPVNLNSAYQVDSLEVTLSLKILGSTWNCGWRDPGFDEVEITKIEK